MKVLHIKRPLPRDFIAGFPGAGILLEADIAVTPRGRLHAKLLVFESRQALRKFWRGALGKSDLGSKCSGAVNGLAQEVIGFHKGKQTSQHLEVDPRYFCVIGLLASELWLEVIAHEAVHAAFAYANRQKGDFWPNALELDEERICYPAGRITRKIHAILADSGLYERTFTKKRGYDANMEQANKRACKKQAR